MQRRTMPILAAGGAAALALLAWAFSPRPLAVEVAEAALGRFELTVDEDARTRLVERYTVSAPLAGRLARIGLREGDAVEAGAALASITPALAPLLDERSTQEARARAQGAEAGLQRAGVRIERARVGLAQAEADLKRSEQLARQGFVSATKLDSERLAVQAAAKEIETAEQERHIARHDLEQARAALAALRPAAAGAAPRGGFVLRAPIAGQVLKVQQASEASVTPGTPLMELGNLERLEIVAELLTTDALRATPGTPVRIERWGGSGTLDGRVRRVEPAAFTKISALGVEEQRVNVLIALTSPRESWRALGDGYRVGVRIVVLAVEQALQVPTSAVFPLPMKAGVAAASGAASAPAGDGSRTMGVFAVREGRARLVPVALRSRNGHMAWIGEGLTAGDRVIVYPPGNVADGVRVRLREP